MRTYLTLFVVLYFISLTQTKNEYNDHFGVDYPVYTLAPLAHKSQIAPNVTQAPKRMLTANTTTYHPTTTPYAVYPNLTVYYQFSTQVSIYYMNTTTW